MAARKKAAPTDDVTETTQDDPGYIGRKVDPEPNETYTLQGVYVSKAKD